MLRILPWLFSLILLIPNLFAQDDLSALKSQVKQLENRLANLRHQFDQIDKTNDDLLWYHKVGDVAHVDKVYLTGPPKSKQQTPNKTAQGAGNPLRFWSYVFIPKGLNPDKKYPLIVFPHGGVHSNFNTFYAHIIRELMAQEYVVVAAEYRGSTGYGRGFYESIDYGGLEIEDVDASRDFMLNNYDFLDEDRVGIMGWSHGGLISLMNLFEHAENYKVAYAGVPVSDLVARMGYKTERYRDLYSVDYHIGKTAYADVNEYRRRSPAWNAHKLQTPLLIHTNTNDGDVNVLEVEHLIKSLKAEDKDFEYEIYEDIPGGHSFDRMDTKHAREVRLKVYTFLAKYLKPNKPLKNMKALNKASYGF
ncbi:MAG: prolyl oligopeptidase family serine peptidase [Bacteroidota bacterium]